jgi:hypothetical protein
MKLGLLSSTANSVTYRVVTLVAQQAVGGEVGTCAGVAVGDDCPLVTTGTAFTLTDDGVTDLTIANAGDGSGLEGTFQAVAQGGAALDGTETPVPLLDDQGDGDATNDTVDLFTFEDQYAGTAGTGVSKVIDVDPAAATDRKAIFTDGTSTDTIAVDFTEVVAGHHALTSGLVVTVSGDFSWIYDTDAVTAGTQPAVGVVAATDITGEAATIAVDATSVTVTYASAAVAHGADLDVTEGLTITFDNSVNLDAGGVNPMEIEDTSFTVSSVIEYQPYDDDYTDANNDNDADDAGTYDSDAATDLAGISSAGGAFSYNGSVVDVYAMPTSFAKNLPFIWITNSGAEAGEVFAVATTEDGTTVDMGEIGTIGATEIKSFSTAVQDAITAEGITTGRVTLELTTSVPSCDVNVSAQYYNMASMDRAALETSQTIGNVYATDEDSTDANRCNL